MQHESTGQVFQLVHALKVPALEPNALLGALQPLIVSCLERHLWHLTNEEVHCLLHCIQVRKDFSFQLLFESWKQKEIGGGEVR